MSAWACTTPGADAALDAPAPPPAASADGASAFCGDGVWNGAEECDDGAACSDGRECTSDRFRCQGVTDRDCAPRGGDGCSDQCRVEIGYTCPGGAACSKEGAPGPDPGTGAAPAGSSENPASLAEASADAGPRGAPEPPCPAGSFDPPERVAGLDDSLTLWAPSLAPDGLTLYFSANPSEGIEQLYSARRAGRSSQFSNATPLTSINSGLGEGSPFLSSDGLTLYFYSLRPGGADDRDLWSARRPDDAADFGGATPLEGVNTADMDHLPWLSPDERTLIFASTRAGGLGLSDIWIASRASAGADLADAVPLVELNTSSDEGRVAVSSDGLTLLFVSDRPGGVGGPDLWMSTRSDASAAFNSPTNLTALNSPGYDVDVSLAAGDSELWFASNRGGRNELWRSVRACDADPSAS